MGYLGFIWSSSTPVAEHDVTFDLTTAYAPRKPVLRAPKPPTSPIPIEIVINILEAGYYTDNLESDDALLTNCALVCKDWSYVAQKLLFRHVTLRTQTASYARCIRPQSAVPSLSTFLRRAVTLCPNLYEVHLALYGEGAPGQDIVGSPDASRMKRPAPSFDERTLALLRSGPRISALQFSNWSDNSSSLLQLLDVWPELMSLDVSGTPPQLPNASLPPSPCALTELRTNFQVAPSVEFMQWLLHNSANTLRVLDLAREPSPDMLEFLASEYGAGLHSLALPACGTHDSAAAVRKCTQLRELKLESAWASPVLYKALPETLQHLAIGVGSDTPLQPVLQMIKRSEELRVVTMHVWDDGEHHPQFSAAKIACTIRGVQLRITRDMLAFRAMTRGDPVPTTTYPRLRSLENIQYMHSRASTTPTSKAITI
ncbi:hypothetical protein A0H81_11471 [Grifola frondosa]|uniref:Uncharacterized protein n=1 Tax=Grifola frondosa TaxID=5627 RepID=A0A1C7LVT0_GRIFR|nr:hypothetical protein A0H81_11471 [Grifola frondosa]